MPGWQRESLGEHELQLQERGMEAGDVAGDVTLAGRKRGLEGFWGCCSDGQEGGNERATLSEGVGALGKKHATIKNCCLSSGRMPRGLSHCYRWLRLSPRCTVVRVHDRVCQALWRACILNLPLYVPVFNQAGPHTTSRASERAWLSLHIRLSVLYLFSSTAVAITGVVRWQAFSFVLCGPEHHCKWQTTTSSQ